MMLFERKYNITKLINSDSTIYKSYKNIKNIKDKNFWDNFIERQKGNNTYIAGGYKQCVWDKEDNGEDDKEKPINIIFEDLEKDKYFYDDYETNYLYHNEKMKKEIENNIPEIKSLNDYSMNKVNENNFFYYSFQCLNAYNEGTIKNKNMRNHSCSNIKFGDIKEKKFENYSRNKIRLKKEELLNRIKNMKNQYENQKKINNSFHITLKAINKENHDMYKLAQFEPSNIPVYKILSKFLNNTFLIKDLELAFNISKSQIERKKIAEEKSSSSYPTKCMCERNLINNYEKFYKEIKSLYEKCIKIKKNIKLAELEKIANFLLKTSEMVLNRMVKNK